MLYCPQEDFYELRKREPEKADPLFFFQSCKEKDQGGSDRLQGFPGGGRRAFCRGRLHRRRNVPRYLKVRSGSGHPEHVAHRHGTILYDSDGNEIETLVMAGSNRKPVDYSELPEDLINAFVAIEDERFWTHKGVDVKGLARAVYSGLTSGSLDEGASTITQQLIKNVALTAAWSRPSATG